METYAELLKKIPDSIYKREWDPDEAKPGIVRLFELYSFVFDNIHTIVEEIAALKDLDTQKGKVLDEIGKIVREPRAGKSDAIYRNFLMIAIQRNISNGSLAKIADITDLIISSDEDAGFELTEVFPIVLLDSIEPVNPEDPPPDTALDANWILNPYIQEPATFELELKNISADNPLAEYLAGAVNEIKATGVNAKIKI